MALCVQAQDILALIGYFDLDPNRVVSAILSAWAEQPDSPHFMELLPHFK